MEGHRRSRHIHAGQPGAGTPHLHIEHTGNAVNPSIACNKRKAARFCYMPRGCPSTHLVVGAGVLLPKVQPRAAAAAAADAIRTAAAAVFYSDAQLILAAAAAAFALRRLCRSCRQADAQLGLALALQLALIQIESRLRHCGCLPLRGLVDRCCHRFRQLLPANKRRGSWVVARGGAAGPTGRCSAALLPWLKPGAACT